MTATIIGWREIPLTQGCVALVDVSDYERISAFKWFAMRNGSMKRLYAARNVRNLDGSKRVQYLHRFLLEPATNLVVDHINHDGLDNRRANLRAVPRGINNRNRLSAQRNSNSGILNVSWNKQIAKWRARGWRDGRAVYLGVFVDSTEAAQVARAFSAKEMGDYAG